MLSSDCVLGRRSCLGGRRGAGLLLSFSLAGPEGEELPSHLSRVFLADSRLFVHVTGPHTQPVCVLGLLSGKAHSFIFWALATLPLSCGNSGEPCVGNSPSSWFMRVPAPGSFWVSVFPSEARVRLDGLRQGLLLWALSPSSTVWTCAVLTRSELPREDGTQTVTANCC